MENREHDQFSQFFGVLGAVVGFFYGAAVSNGEWAAALFGALIFGGIGLLVGSVVYRVLVFGFFVLGIFIRHEIFEAVGKLFE